MKRILLIGLFIYGLTTCIFGQTDNSLASSATCANVTVYTDNGAYVKAKNSSPYEDYTVEISFTETYIKNGEKLSTQSTYNFSIVYNEEKQLFASQNAISNIQITSCKVTNVDMEKLHMDKMKAKAASGN